MQARAFLNIARRLVNEADEASWRTGAGRAYYTLLLECRSALERWGFRPSPRDQVHTFVRLRFSYAVDRECKEIGNALERLGRLRNEADYQLPSSLLFSSALRAQRAVVSAEENLDRLDRLEQDTQRLATVVAGLRKSFP